MCGVFSETEGPGIGADLGSLVTDLVDLLVLLVHSVHTGLKVATMLVRLAGQFPGTTVIVGVFAFLWRL